ncbi:MAG: YraN family protein [Rhodothermaceae bacterium]|nr:YraN family protein [Rhodothermaceae bacterium]
MEARKTPSQHTGSHGEDIAADYLEKKRYKIVHRNYRCRRGEIDIICLDETADSGNNVLVFVEVKARRVLDYGAPSESVTTEKIGRMRRAAEVYIMMNGLEEVCCRFDVVGIVFNRGETQIEHIQDVIDY